MAALLDTGFLLAVIDADDNLHAACVAALESETNPILPDVVLPELAYLIFANSDIQRSQNSCARLQPVR